MSESVQIAAFVLIAGAIGTLFAMLIGHINHCRDVQRLLGELAASLKRVEQDIGTHETGLRGQVHKLASDITPYILSQQHPERRK